MPPTTSVGSPLHQDPQKIPTDGFQVLEAIFIDLKQHQLIDWDRANYVADEDQYCNSKMIVVGDKVVGPSYFIKKVIQR